MMKSAKQFFTKKNNVTLRGAALALSALLVFSGCDVITAGIGGTAKPPTGGPVQPGQSASPGLPPVDAKARPWITEVMSSNHAALPANGGYPDWVEISNLSQGSLDLGGYMLSDNIKEPKAYTFPQVILGPGQSVVLFCNDVDGSGKSLQAGFKLSSAGEELVLTAADGTLVQKLTLPAIPQDQSYAASSEDAEKYAITADISPGYPNTAEGRAAWLSAGNGDAPVRLNEVMTAGNALFTDEDGAYGAWVELRNFSEQSHSLKGYHLSNNLGKPGLWALPDRALEPGAVLLVWLDGKDRDGDAPHAGFQLGEGEAVGLSDAQGQVVSTVTAGSLTIDESFGVDLGSMRWKSLEHPTPGYNNNEEGFNALQAKLYPSAGDSLALSEVMTTNADTLTDQFKETPQWVEIVNRSGEDINLKGYGLTDNAAQPLKWKFPKLTLKSGEYLTVFLSGRDQTAGAALSKRQLHTSFKLKDGGDSLTLSDPDGKRIDFCLVPKLRAGVSYGRPDGQAAFAYLSEPTPGEGNESKSFSAFAEEPVFSLQGGQYQGEQKVAITSASPDATIYYTTDGTVPTAKSKQYYNPVEITKSTPLRAVAIQDGAITSQVTSATYLINEEIKLPIISIVTDPKNLYDKDTGILADGPGYTEEFPHHGANYYKDWERPAHLQLIEPDGTVGISQDMGLKVAGQFSRGWGLKSLSFHARSKYGKGKFEYKIFPNRNFDRFDSFLVRASGNDVNRSRIRDVLVTSLVEDTTDTISMQAYRNCVIFINGQFWGVSQIREKINDHFVAQHFGVDEEKVTLLEGNSIEKYGSNDEWKELMAYVKAHNLKDDEAFAYVDSKVDIDSYLDWYATEICSGNSDMGNIRFWKTDDPDSQWKWIFYDFCWAFGDVDRPDIAYDLNPKGNGYNHAFSTALINGLLKRPEIKEKFLQRLAFHINVTFKTETVLQRIDELAGEIDPYMERDFEKWNFGTYKKWQNQVEKLRDYAKEHPGKLKAQMKSYFKLSEAKMAELFPED